MNLNDQLQNHASVISGFAFKSEWFGNGNDKVIRIGDLQDNRIQLESALNICAKAYQISDTYRIKKNDILIALSGATVGKIAVATQNDIGSYINQRVAIIRGNNTNTSNYLKYAFHGLLLRKLLQKAGGAAQPNLSPKKILLMELPFPPLEEQRRIGSILDQADELRQKRQESINKLDELLQATFIEMFGDPVTNPKGWDIYKLSSLCFKISVGIVVRPASYYTEHGIPAIRSLNIGDNKIIKENFVYFSEKDNDTILQKTKLEAGDVVTIRSGQPGKSAVIQADMSGCNAIDVLITKTNINKLLPDFLSFFLNSSAGKLLVLKEQRGQVQKHLNVGQLSAATIPLPPISLQRIFINRITQIELLKKQLVNQLEQQNNLFNSLQQQAFSGKL